MFNSKRLLSLRNKGAWGDFFGTLFGYFLLRLKLLDLTVAGRPICVLIISSETIKHLICSFDELT